VLVTQGYLEPLQRLTEIGHSCKNTEEEFKIKLNLNTKIQYEIIGNQNLLDCFSTTLNVFFG
jgi:hypothetical protein